jgi:hypothetical protein
MHDGLKPNVFLNWWLLREASNNAQYASLPDELFLGISRRRLPPPRK